MKQLLAGVLAFGICFVLGATGVSAHEGNLNLTSSNVSCTGISLWQDGQYHVTGRCDGLVYPFQTQYDNYTLWAKTDTGSDVVRVADIDKGYFDGGVADPFTTVFVTAETSTLAHRPSSFQIASGTVTSFTFDKSAAVITPTSTTSTTDTGTTVAAATSTATSNVGSVVTKILTSLLVIILIIVGLAIGASLVFRSRGSVSA